MRWMFLLLSLAAIGVLEFLAVYAAAAHSTHAYSTYRFLVDNQLLVDSPTLPNGEPVDVASSLQAIGSGGYYATLAHIGSAFCLSSGVVFFVLHKPNRAGRDT